MAVCREGERCRTDETSAKVGGEIWGPGRRDCFYRRTAFSDAERRQLGGGRKRKRKKKKSDVVEKEVGGRGRRGIRGAEDVCERRRTKKERWKRVKLCSLEAAAVEEEVGERRRGGEDRSTESVRVFALEGMKGRQSWRRWELERGRRGRNTAAEMVEGTEEEEGRDAGVMGSPSVAEWCMMVERETEYSTWMVEKRMKRSKERRREVGNAILTVKTERNRGGKWKEMKRRSRGRRDV